MPLSELIDLQLSVLHLLLDSKSKKEIENFKTLLPFSTNKEAAGLSFLKQPAHFLPPYPPNDQDHDVDIQAVVKASIKNLLLLQDLRPEPSTAVDQLLLHALAGGILAQKALSEYDLRAVDCLSQQLIMPIYSYGMKMRMGSKKPRKKGDALQEKLKAVVSNFYQTNKRPPDWRQVIKELQQLALNSDYIIREVSFTEETISWDDGNKQRTTSFARTRDRLTEIRAEFPPL